MSTKTDCELMQQALDALTEADDHWCCSDSHDTMLQASIQALRARLNEPVVQADPVAQCKCQRLGDFDGYQHHPLCDASKPAAQPVEEQPCTCPSGDGSLRWPCPAHPVAVPAMTPGYVPVPPQVVEDALTALGHFVSDEGWDDFDLQAMDNLDACMAQHKALQASAPKEGGAS